MFPSSRTVYVALVLIFCVLIFFLYKSCASSWCPDTTESGDRVSVEEVGAVKKMADWHMWEDVEVSCVRVVCCQKPVYVYI